MKELFHILDVNKDGYIDLKDWSHHFPDDVISNNFKFYLLKFNSWSFIENIRCHL